MRRNLNSRTKAAAALMEFAVACLLMVSITSSSSLAAQALPSYADLSEQVKHSVVNIFTTQVIELRADIPEGSPFGEFFEFFFKGHPGMKHKANALGSGVIIDESGLIITNHHVVAKADEIKIRLEDNVDAEYDAKVVGRDPQTDLALIRVEPDKKFPPPAKLGNSDAIRVGDGVMAVGNPFGLGHTVTVGILSAKGRIIGAGPYDDFLQTDAAINPGNSGGPLFNLKGEVIGINTAIVARGQGIGFAIPVNLAKELLPQLKTGKVARGYLGVVIQEVTPKLAESFDLKSSQGVLISDVADGGPADKAGLQSGDVMQTFNGKPLESAQELSRMVAGTRPETAVTAEIIRNGERHKVEIQIGALPGESTRAARSEPESEKKWGMTVQELTPKLARRLGMVADSVGVVVTGVGALSPADKAGLRRGDVIKRVERQDIRSTADLSQAIKKNESKDDLLLLVQRSGNTFYVVLEG